MAHHQAASFDPEEAEGDIVLQAHAGPQTHFLASRAFLVLYGGAGGGGKSWALIFAAVLHAVSTPGWTGLICRNKQKDLDKPGGLWTTAKKIARLTGGHARAGSPRDITWPGGGRLVFDYLAKRNFENYRGAELAYVGIDEANECPIEAIVFLMSRLRTTCGAEPVMRLTCNPDPDHELAKWVDPHYLLDGGEFDGCPDREQAGRIRYFARRAKDDQFMFADTAEEAAKLADREVWEAKSFTFIDALLDDNPSLAKDKKKRRDYLANLAMQGAVVEDQLRRGNWRAKPGSVGMLSLELWGGGEWMVEPVSPIIKRIRAWDLASTEPRPGNKDPDYTVGVLMGWDAFGRWYIEDVVICRKESDGVDDLLAETAAADGPSVTQVIETEGGSSGKRDTKTTRKVLKSSGKCGPVIDVRAIQNKRAKARAMANELRLGMVGNRPRTHFEDKGPRSPRGYFLNATGWMTRLYEDAGNALPTVGAIVMQQVKRFIDAQVHDDVPDAMSIAHNQGTPKRVHKPRVGDRWDNLS